MTNYIKQWSQIQPAVNHQTALHQLCLVATHTMRVEPVVRVLSSVHRSDQSDRHQAEVLSGPWCGSAAAICTLPSCRFLSWQCRWCHGRWVLLESPAITYKQVKKTFEVQLLRMCRDVSTQTKWLHYLLKLLKAHVSLSQFSWKAVPQLQTCSCKTPVSIVAVGSSVMGEWDVCYHSVNWTVTHHSCCDDDEMSWRPIHTSHVIW